MHDGLQERILNWAEQQPAIRAVVAVGSRARAQHRADRWSDLDLILFATEPERYGASPQWLHTFAEVWLAVAGRTGHGDAEWDVLYAGGAKVDFVIAPAGDGTAPLVRLLAASPYQAVYARGVRALLDKNDRAVRAPLPSFAPDTPKAPDPQAFSEQQGRFLLDAVRAARFVARGELWRAKMLCDCALKQQLLTMLEWHALASAGTSIWYDGRYMEEWADSSALRELPGTFGAYERADLARALLATIRLYRRLADEVAEHFALAGQHDSAGAIVALIEQTLRDSSTSQTGA